MKMAGRQALLFLPLSHLYNRGMRFRIPCFRQQGIFTDFCGSLPFFRALNLALSGTGAGNSL